MIAQFCKWLATTALSEWIQNTVWVIPMVQSVHILAVAVVMSSVLMMDLRLLGVVGRGASMAELERRFLPPVWIALGVLLVSGIVLIIGEPRRELLNDVFRLKMLMVIIVTGLTLFLRDRVAASPSAGAPTVPIKLAALISLMFWLSILTAGRWIAYTVDG